MKKRFLSILLALCLVTQFVPTAALAAQPDAVSDGATTALVTTETEQSPDQVAGDGEDGTTDNEGQTLNDEAETGGAAAVALTLLLPDGIYADGGAATGAVTRTAGEDGKIDPIVISCEDEGTFSAELAEAINKNSSISENGLHVTYSADSDTLTLSGSPTASAQLDMEEILIAAMNGSSAYNAELADTVAKISEVLEVDVDSEIGITIERGSADGYILVKSGVTLTLDGATVDGKSIESTYPMIKVERGGTLIIKSGTVIKNCVTSGDGGAIHNSGTLTMEGGEIANCSAGRSGGGVCNDGTFNMAGGSIAGNEAKKYGGGVFNDGTFTMTDGSVSNSSANAAGGVFNQGTFAMNGGSITGNKATIDGGGVCNDGELTMTGGSVTDNNADYIAGGVMNYNVFAMSGGSITGNDVASGLGGPSGGGVFSDSYGTLKLSDKVIIAGNKVNSAPNNAYLYGGGTITVAADGMAADASVGITSSNPGDITVVTGTTATAGFFSDNETYALTPNDTNDGLKLVQASTLHRHKVCVEENCTNADHGNVETWTGISSLSDINKDGYYYLTSSVTLGNTWTCAHDVKLCLNGNTITGASGQDAIKVAVGSSLAITDCTKEAEKVGKITHNKDQTGRGVYVDRDNYGNYGTFALWNGNITGNSISGEGGGVFNYGSISMYGGSIGNNSANYGGGVANYKTFSMSGGSINGNSAAVDDGGVSNYATFTMTGGGIYGNTAEFDVGGVYSCGTFDMSGGGIYGNTAKENAGGVSNYATFTMTGGSIYGNTANKKAAGFYNTDTLKLSGDVTITGNTVDGVSDNVYLAYDSYSDSIYNVTVTGALGDSSSVGITAENPDGNPVVVTGSTDTKVFSSDDTNYEMVLDGDSSLKLAKIPAHEHCVCGGTTDIGDHTEHTTNVTWTRWTGTNSLPADAGNYYLANDVQLSGEWTVGSGVDIKLCLNGKTVTGANGRSAINNMGALTITDCTTDAAKVGKITHKDGGYGRGIACSGALYLYNGCITGNTVDWDGGGLNLGDGSFNMYGGEFSNNKALGGRTGGAVYVGCHTTFNMYGGSITGNTAEYGCGGGVMVDGNDDAGWHGNLNMSGGVISGNSAEYGGGVYNKSTLTMSGGSITGNSASGTNGGGVYNYGSEHTACNMSGNPVVRDNVTGGSFDDSGNLAGGTANNVYLSSGKAITVESAKPMDGTAEVYITGTEDQAVVTGTTETTGFYCDNGGYKLEALTEEGATGLRLVKNIQTHCVCGKTDCGGDGHDTTTIWQPWTRDDSLPTDSGNFYLTDDVELSETWNCAADVKLCLNGHDIIETGNADAIKVNDGASLAITDCTTDAEKVGKITHKTNETGRGISNYGTFTLWNGSIADNAADAETGPQGGGVWNSGTFTMNGGSISNNSAVTYGGGVSGDGMFTMSGGSISNNKTDLYGGGVDNDGTFEMTGGSIVNNSTSGDGGGVYNTYEFTMTGGSIAGNFTADNGKGGAVFNYGIFTMSDGAITGNSAKSGGGVYDNYTLELSGNATIKDNTVSGVPDNVYLPSGSAIAVPEGGSMGADAFVGITSENPGDTTVVTGTTDTTGFFSDDDTYGLTPNEDNGLKLVLASTLHRHKVCVEKDCTNADHGNVETWTGISSLSDINKDGYYYLTTSVALDNTWTCAHDVKLCLNGNTITEASGQDTIKISAGASLSITDCTKEAEKVGKITHETGKAGRGIYVDANGALALWNGTITGNSIDADYGGGGVCNEGTFNMAGGSVTGNTATTYGGGVRNFGALSISGGSVADNSAEIYGGGVCNYGTLTMSGGSIERNSSGFQGGGVFNVTESFTMSGGRIAENKAEKGAGVTNIDDSTFAMTGGSIESNYANSCGGGVYNWAKGTINLSGNVVIADNTVNDARCNLYIEFKEEANYDSSGELISTTEYNGKVVVTGAMGDSASVGITAQKPDSGATVVSGSTNTKVFFSDDADYELLADGESSLKLVKVHKHKVCNDAACQDHGDLKWTGISSLDQITGDDNYYLTGDVYLGTTWECDYDVNLCLNGYDIIETGNADAIKVDAGASLAITDCTPVAENVGKVTHGTGKTGRGIYVDANGALALWNGSISGNYVEGYGNDGGGICNFGTFDMHDGNVVNNSTTSYGGGVYSSGFCTMSGGNVANNTAGWAGGGVYNAYEFAMSDGSISNNNTDHYGDGGGVYNKGTFAMTGGSIEHNTAGYAGGGVLNYNTSTMTGGSIVDNKAATFGGGVFDFGKFNLSGNVNIKDNTVNSAANNVHLGSGRTIAVADGATLAGASVGITYANPDDGKTVVTGSADTTVFSSDDSNYELLATDGGLKLSAKTVTISGVKLLVSDGGSVMTEDQSKVYDGLAVAYDASNVAVEPGTVTGWELSYTWQKATVTDGVAAYADLDAAPSDAGSYRLLVIAKRGEVELGTCELPFTITQREVTISGLSASKTYDGDATAEKAEITGTAIVGNKVAEADDVSLNTENMRGTFNSADADKATTVTLRGLSLTGSASANYNLPETVTCAGSITKARGSGSVTLDGWTYGEAAKTPKPTSETNGTDNVTYKYKVKDADDGTYSGTVPSDAGDYTVKATFAATGNYEAVDATTNFTIAKAGTMTVSGTHYSAAYDGKSHGEAAVPSVAEGTKVEYSIDGGATWGQTVPTVKDVAEVTVKVRATNQNYKQAETSYTLKVTPKGYTVVTDSASKVYDGKALTAGGKIEGIVDGEDAGFAVTGSQTNAGTSTNTYKIEWNGNAKQSNYKLEKETLGALEVTRAAVTVTAETATKVYGTSDPTFTAKVTGLVNGESADLITYSVARQGADEAVGTYTGVIVPSGEATQGNYTVTYVPGNFMITRSDELTVVGTNYEGVYDGAEHGLAATPSVTEGTKVEYSIDGGAWSETVPAVKDVADVTVKVRATNPNYEQVETTYTLKVTPRGYTVTTATDTKVYDGVELTAGGKIEGILDGEDAGFQVAGGQTEVGESKNTYEVKWDGSAKKGNYTLAGETVGTLSVTAQSIVLDPSKPDSYKGVTISDPTNVVYNGTEQKWVPGVKDSNSNKLVENRDYIVTYSNDVTNVGTVAVTITGTGNYAGTVERTYKISAKPLTIDHLVIAEKYYDGTDEASFMAKPVLVGVVGDEEVTLVNGVPTFTSVAVERDIPISFTDFKLDGADAGNYALTQPSGITGDISPYNAFGTEYATTTTDWASQDFVVTANSGWLVSETNTAEGAWSESLTRSAETGSAGDRLTFYVKSRDHGFISEAITKTYRIDKTAPAIAGAEDGKTYCAAVELAAADANLDTVTVNGKAVEPAADEVMALAVEAPAGFTFTVQPAEGEQTVVATDMAGNATTLKLTVNDGHTWGAWSSNGNGTHTHACEYDAATETADCHGGTATCIDRAVCDDCGQPYGEVDASNHAALTHVEAKAATATAEGNIEYWHCEACGKYFADAAGEKEIQQADTVVAKKAEAPDGDKGDSTDGKTDGDKTGGEEPGKSQVSRTGDPTAAAWPPAVLGAAALAAVLVSARRRRS